MFRHRSGVAFVPLWVKSNGSFLEGASQPEELVARAHELGLPAIALTDRNGFYGSVRAHMKHAELAKLAHGACRSNQEGRSDVSVPRAILGAEVTVLDVANDTRVVDNTGALPGTRRVVLLAENRVGYGRITRLLTRGHARAETKGAARVTWDDVRTLASEDVVALAPDASSLFALADSHRGRLYAMLTRHLESGDDARERLLREAAAHASIPTIAQREVLYHDRSRQPLQDVLTCVRHGVTLSTAGTLLRPNAEHDLPDLRTMLSLFRDDPVSVHRSGEVADRCRFHLGLLRYRYPAEKVPHGQSEKGWLRELTFEGARVRYPRGIPDDCLEQIEKELALIEELDYGGYFLTMWDVVRFCREANILCQGRGSAANSIVCYCLGITAIDPVRMDLLFERFLSRERAEPPDIDVDIEHDRREEVIQYVYERWGRGYTKENIPEVPLTWGALRRGSEAPPGAARREERSDGATSGGCGGGLGPPPCAQGAPMTAMVANVIRYRVKSALRDVGKALDLPELVLDRASKVLSHYDDKVEETLLRDAGLDPEAPVTRHLLSLVTQVLDFPRHLGIHPGGFVLGHEPVDTLCPIEPATMPNRTVVQWDKQDIEDLGLFKIDLLGLGCLTVIHRAFDLLREHDEIDLEIRTVPAEDPTTYAMVSRADTVGVFQIESRAQMAMLPRLAPRTFYDLVIEVAIVRPGPIQGDMVHPYLRRREGKEVVSFPHPKLERVLKKTLGVPIFQEQVMKLAVAVAGYTPGEADQLRRDMAAWRSKGRIEQHREKLVTRMVEDGIPLEFAERVFMQIRGFGEYGFPESHAASFALLAYVTAWLKCHHPAAFACAMLDAWPMGFYHPSTIVDDVKRHGVPVLPIDVNKSGWQCRLEPVAQRGWGIRMGLRYVKGLGEREERAFTRERERGAFVDLTDFARRTRMNKKALHKIAEAGAFASLGLDRRASLWELSRLARENLAGIDWEDEREGDETSRRRARRARNTTKQPAWIQELGKDERISWDYRASLHSTRGHPMEAYRERLIELGYPEANVVARMRRGGVKYAGLVICRQRPQTATGVFFMTLEDETGFVNVVCWADVFAKFERVAKTSVLLEVRGQVQEENGVVHVIAAELRDLSRTLEDETSARKLGDLEKSRDFH
jgi:error-prone DNA polymerase